MKSLKSVLLNGVIALLVALYIVFPAYAEEKPMNVTIAANPTAAAEVKGEILTGAELDSKKDKDGAVQFTNQGVTVTFSSEAVKGFGINADETVAVNIERQGDESFTIDVTANGEKISDIPDTIVLMGIKANTAEDLTLTSAEGESIMCSSYQKDLNLSHFTVSKTGTYAISNTAVFEEAPAEEAAPAENGSIWGGYGFIISVGCIIASLLLGLFVGRLRSRYRR